MKINVFILVPINQPNIKTLNRYKCTGYIPASDFPKISFLSDYLLSTYTHEFLEIAHRIKFKARRGNPN